MEDVFQKRILENLTNEEKDVIIENRNIVEKIYLIGLIDGTLVNVK